MASGNDWGFGDFDVDSLWDDIVVQTPKSPTRQGLKKRVSLLGTGTGLTTYEASGEEPPRAPKGPATKRVSLLGTGTGLTTVDGAASTTPRRGSLGVGSSLWNLFGAPGEPAEEPEAAARPAALTKRPSFLGLGAKSKSAPKIKSSAGLSAALISAYRDTFRELDTDASGQLSPREVAKALRLGGATSSLAEVEDMVRDVDRDGDGEVDFREFVQLMSAKNVVDKETLKKVKATASKHKSRSHRAKSMTVKEVSHFSDIYEAFDLNR